ncbi:MAG: hypothetical protein M3518_01530 [Actinomycetota bacterium]|nr:hypothetical protein [Actinomycetota bacterium]
MSEDEVVVGAAVEESAAAQTEQVIYAGAAVDFVVAVQGSVVLVVAE